MRVHHRRHLLSTGGGARMTLCGKIDPRYFTTDPKEADCPRCLARHNKRHGNQEATVGTGIDFDRVTFDNGFTVLLSRPKTGAPRAEWEAFARLIAAAPRLRDALARLADQVERIELPDGSTPDTLDARMALLALDAIEIPEVEEGA